MNKARKIKLVKLLLIAAVISLVVALVLYALRQNINLFYSPSELISAKIAPNTTIKIGGMVMENSVVRDGLTVNFKVTDYKNTIDVTYRGSLPTLFREKQSVIAMGKFSDNNSFIADEILAKHDENYMPVEVRDSLAHKGYK